MSRVAERLLAVWVAGIVVALVPAALPTGAASAASAAPGEPTGPPTVTPDDIRFTPHRALRRGSPREVGLLADQVDRMVTDARSYLEPTPDHPTYPTYPGAVVLAAKDGVLVQHAAVGRAVRYGVRDGRVVELPPAEQLPMRPDTLFDLASVTKLFTTIAVLQQVERGRIVLDAPVVGYLPAFGEHGKAAVTVRHLLTHTAGLPAFRALYRDFATPAERLAAVYASEFHRFPDGTVASPGGQYLYSDLGLITLGSMVEQVTGRPLDRVIREDITDPLGMRDTMFNPPASLRERIAATEYEPWAGRTLVWGEVHDENAWSLGGVAGHAGMFSTAADLAVFCQLLLGGGAYRGTRILREDTVRAMLVNQNAHLESRFPESDRGLGFELHKHWYMGPLASPVTFGHTGFTGTSIVIDPLAHSFVVFLSNRVHPDRTWGGNNPARRAVTRAFGYAIPVRPAAGPTAWRADWRDSSTVTLTAALRRPADRTRLTFSLYFDTEPRYDRGALEASLDGGATYQLVPMTLRGPRHVWSTDGTFTGYAGRRWLHVVAAVPDGATHLRWSYTTDINAQGRGVYVDGVLAVGKQGVLLHGEIDTARFVADGFSEAST